MYNILLAGSTPEVARLTAGMIEKNGYRVKVITEPELDEEFEPKVIILDCDMSIPFVVRRFGNLLRKYRNARIMWISPDGEDEVAALEAGADEWIKKPFQMEVLMARIDKLCKA